MENFNDIKELVSHLGIVLLVSTENGISGVGRANGSAQQPGTLFLNVLRDVARKYGKTATQVSNCLKMCLSFITVKGALPLAASTWLRTSLLRHNQPKTTDGTNGHCPFYDQPRGHEPAEWIAQSE